MLDSDLACLYGVTTFNLNKAVSRNPRRFPGDFMFKLTLEEAKALTFQTGISNKSGRGGRRHAPYVFTEHGVAMLSSVLRSERAVQVSISIMRAFAQLRNMLATHGELAQKLAELEAHWGTHDNAIQEILKTIHDLMEPVTERRTERIGFHPRTRQA